ncbi:MAG: methylmalonyl Co-A mutase-associated GTPase MeaB [candidate division Zixibacteria bacterium]|jgi:LAO/AO transport system kinase|nr:methylmalonyl Co-A mutase-associated GTPase MeaB [candidate division Zixibacteria bacterium]
MTVLERFYEGDIRALSRLVSHVENRTDGYLDVLSRLYEKVGGAIRIGITGPPGAGKSTLVNCLAHRLLRDGLKVGVIAVDPTSPFTGGALLGDRVRLADFPTDGSFYFRSMATRGASGGLAGATDNVTILYDAFGFDVTLLETVGVGQVELDIVDSCDTVAVIVVPESGDSVQTMKAGLMEIADLFCVNKSDRPGADRILSELRQMLKMRKLSPDQWSVPVVKTIATSTEGIEELHGTITKHREHMQAVGAFEQRRRRQIRKKLTRILQVRFSRMVEERLPESTNIEQVIEDIYEGKTDPFTASDRILKISLNHFSAM